MKNFKKGQKIYIFLDEKIGWVMATFMEMVDWTIDYPYRRVKCVLDDGTEVKVDELAATSEKDYRDALYIQSCDEAAASERDSLADSGVCSRSCIHFGSGGGCLWLREDGAFCGNYEPNFGD